MKTRAGRIRGRSPRLKHRIRFVNLSMALLLSGGLCSSSAGLRIWDGSSSGYWSSGMNWVFGGAGPQSGDDLAFAPGPSRLVMTNDLAANTALNSLIFTGPGYVVSGNPLVLNSGLHASHNGGTTRVLLTPTFTGTPSITTSNTTSLLVLEGPVRYDSPGLTFNVTGPIVVSNSIREFFASAPIVKLGTGTLELAASNRFDGTLFVREGTLFANHHAALGNATGQGTVVSNGATLLIGRGLSLLESSITLAGSLVLNAIGSGSASIASAVSFGGSNATIDVPIAGLNLNGPISGSNGFRFIGASALFLNGNSPSYTGPTVVPSGQVFAVGQLPLAPFYLAGGQLTGDGRVGPVTSLAAGGRISPGSFNTLTCSNLTLNAATTNDVSVGKVVPTGAVSSKLGVHGTVSLGACALRVFVLVDSMLPGESLTIIENDGSDPVNGTFAGLPEGAAITNMFTKLQISYAGGDGNDVVLTVVPNTRSWVGGAANDNWQSDFNWDGNVRAHIGDDLIFPAGAMRLSNTNSFAAFTPFSSITLGGAGYTLHGNGVLLNAGLSATYASGTSTVALPIRLASNQTFFAASGATLNLNNLEMNGRELTLNGDGEMRLSGVISQAGSLVKTGPGLALLSRSNTYTGTTLVAEGSLQMLTNMALGDSTSGTVVNSGATLSVNPGLTVAEPLTLAGTLNHNSSGAATSLWSGPIMLVGAAAVDVESAPLNITGAISGSGSVTKEGSGSLLLSAINTFSGATVLSQGALIVNGAQPQSPIQLTAGTLGGTGVVGQVFASGSAAKTIKPGDSFGVFSTGNLLLNSFTTFEADLNGPIPGKNHDQLVVNGTVNLGNCQFAPAAGPGLANGHVLRVIDNDGSDAIVGSFSGLPEGATIVASNGLYLRLTYHGGDGNDVEFSVLNPPSTITSVVRTSQGFIEIHGQGLPNVFYALEASTNLARGSWTTVTVDLADGAGLYEMTDVDAGSFLLRFYRVSSP